MKKHSHLLPDAYLTAIGEIIVTFNYLEYSILDIFQTLLSPNVKIARVIGSKIGFRQIKDFTLAVYQATYGEDDDYKILAMLLKEAEELEESRNRVAHCLWASKKFDPVTKEHVEFSTLQTKLSKNKLRYDFIDVTIPSMEALALKISDLNQRVSGLHLRMMEQRKYHFVRYENGNGSR